MAAGQRIEPFEPLEAAARRRSLDQAMAAAPAGLSDFWLFAYGSLMWDGSFPQASAKPARLSGWRRAMCVWTVLARGAPENPGLSLGLLPGGACDGIALRLPEDDRDEILAAIWQREMWTDIYRPTWVSLQFDDGAAPGITFTTNQESRQFAGDLSLAAQADFIRRAEGERGSCRDYLMSTLAHLRSLGIEEPDLRGVAAIL